MRRFDAEWAAPLAIEAMRPDVGLVGPLLVERAGGTILSVGRVVQPTLDDPFAGEPAESPGPWGAFFVTREVSALAPWGVAVERGAFDSVGGLATDVGLDVAVAELCVRLADIGRSALWTPAALLELSTDSPLPRTRTLIGADRRSGRGRRRAPRPFAERRTRRGAYDLFGLAHLGRRLDAYRIAATALSAGDVDLVTSDVFDTVVTRPVATPERPLPPPRRAPRPPGACHARALRGSSTRGRTSSATAAIRRPARRAARRRRTTGAETEIEADPEVAAPECTLDEVWSLMPLDWIDPAAGLAAELDVEADALRRSPRPSSCSAPRGTARPGRARQRHLPHGVAAVALLARAGVDMSLIDAVVTSADHRLGKSPRAPRTGDRGPWRRCPPGGAHRRQRGRRRRRPPHDLGAAAIHVHVPTGTAT